MKNYIVKGKFKAGNSWEKFTKKIESQNETDKVYSIFGSKHGIKRNQIQIESIAEE